MLHSLYLFEKKTRVKRKKIVYADEIFVVGASFFAGIISSFFGIGRIVFVPLMVVNGNGNETKRSYISINFVFASLSGVITHELLGHPDFTQAIFTKIGHL